ncbi:MFS transporter [Streptomyces sp. NPDC088341]|uniref:MFS transporter n=1 Tax=Streptomyces sp. NPDC088341 TaxID=3154870 RepID=UPI0034215B07
MGRRWWALGALVASMLVLGFDLTILNVALPTIAEELGATTGQQQWMADAYVVVFAALMLPAGLLGDRFGRRRMLITGLALFLAGSLMGALVGSVELVIAARAAMGVGGALVMPLALAVLPSLFGDPKDRTKAVGIISAASALGVPLGPIIGGWLLEHFWWGSIFLVNIPMAALGITACVLLLPETSDPAPPRVDTVSTALTALGLGALIYGIIEAPGRGWGSPLVVGVLAAGAALLTALVLRERRSARPMLDLVLLRHRGFLLNTVAATLVMFVMSGLLFLLPVHLQAVLGYGALGTGVRMLPMMGGLMVAARGSGALVRRVGPRAVIGAGLVVLAFAALLGSRTTVDSGYGFTALWLSVAGLGFGFAVVPAMDGAIAALPADRAGSGSGLLMTVRQVGSAVGIALLGSLLAAAYTSGLDTSGLPAAAAGTAGDSVVAAHVVADRLDVPRLAASADAAYIHGMNLALLVCGIAALVSALLVMTLLPDSREPDSRREEDKSTRGGADREREAVRDGTTARERATAGETEGDAGVAPAPADAGQ